MSAGTNYYKFTSDEEVINYLGDDLRRMLYCINKHGYVCQDQCEKLKPNLIEEHDTRIIHILTERTEKSIFYAYAAKTATFIIYDTEVMNMDEAIEIADEFGREFYDLY